MIAVFLILLPLLTGLITFLIRNEKSVKNWSLVAAVSTMLIAIAAVFCSVKPELLSFKAEWITPINSSFHFELDGMGKLLVLLTGIAYPLILLAAWGGRYSKPNNFYGLLLMSQAGLMGVFLSMDALLFYFFWELALIPVYFLCSQWGDVKRVAASFKFFIYTFAGSLLMLIGLLIVYSYTPDRSFALSSFYKADIPYNVQAWLFWLLFIAFAVKIPVFPFHTWQADAYEQSNTPTTMVLSGLMVKMGVFGLLRWVLPLTPVAAYSWGDVISALAITGMLYGSFIAIRQDDMKRLVAYSSLAHMGLMVVAIFAENELSIQGVMIQMFSHGVNIIGLWIVVDIIERRTGTRKLSALGGIAQKAPVLTMLFIVIAFANIALPLTNAFIGEFLMFSGIYTTTISVYGKLFTVLAAVCIILAAIYTLNMAKNAFYGELNERTENIADASCKEKLALGIIIVLILAMGVYPQPILDLTEPATQFILKEGGVEQLLKK